MRVNQIKCLTGCHLSCSICVVIKQPIRGESVMVKDARCVNYRQQCLQRQLFDLYSLKSTAMRAGV